MQFGKRIGPLARRVAAMQIPVYAGNASFFLLLSVFPIVSLLLSLLPYTPLTLEHLLGFCAQLAPDWLMRLLEYFIRTLYKSSSAAIISASVVLTLWSASKGMLSLLYGLDAVAEVRETRGYVQRRLLCVLYTVGMLLALLLTLGLYVGGQALLRFLTGRGFSLAAVLEPVLRHLHLYSLVLLTICTMPTGPERSSASALPVAKSPSALNIVFVIFQVVCVPAAIAFSGL